MGYKLCMAEKPSVARDIAEVIGAKKRCDGYFEGNGYRVTWAVGHLVGLAEPEEYGYVSKDGIWRAEKEKAYSELPLIPDNFKLVVLEATKSQFEIVANLINDDKTDEIINCGDMGAEGHILQWLIRTKAGCTKKVRRFCATSMTEEAIRKAMNNLRPEEEFANIVKGEFCKKKADWIMGMSLSRAESLKYGTNISVGRVQSPTLYFVVKRYLDVKNFKVTNYYGIDTELSEGFHVFWNKDTDGAFPTSSKDAEGRVLDKGLVSAKVQQILGGRTGIITDLTKQHRGNDRPQLFDITELQREANRRYGYTAAVTLATAQALYETQKVLSYPRTDSRYITSDLKPYMDERIKAIGGIEKYRDVVNALLKDGLNIDKKIVDDSKVTDHHALIVTEKINGFDVSAMQPTPSEKKDGVTTETMKNILDLVLSRMIVSFSQPFLYEQTSVRVDFGVGLSFTASGKKPIQYGWKAVQEKLLGKEVEQEDSESDSEQTFSDVKKGQTVTVKTSSLIAKKTTPPKLHTEATLLTAMENAGATIENGAILKGRGIGTQATRAEIISKLFQSGYCETLKKGKTNYIVPTIKGQTIIRVLPRELYSAKITADWETKIAEIAKGEMTEKQFMDEFTVFIKQMVKTVKEKDTGIVFKREQEAVAVCPWCGSDVYRYEEKSGEKKGKIRYYCSNKGCSFSMETTNPTITTFTGKKLTENQLGKLIAHGFIILTCKSKRTGEDYKGKFSIIRKQVGDKIYANLEFTPVKAAKYKKSKGK